MVVNLYKWLAARHPGVWGHVHDNPFYAQVLKKPEEWLYRRDFFQIKKILARHQPDAVLATHAFPFRALALFKSHGHLQIPLFGLVTDFRAHRYWGAPGADIYFASSDDARRDLIRYGIPAEKIKFTGIPLRRDFSSLPPKAEARKKLNLKERKPCVAVMGGGHGLLPENFLKTLLDSDLSKIADWIIVCGSNQQLKNGWEKILKKNGAAPGIRLLGYTQQVPLILRASDILISKAGGVTVSEALAASIPMILLSSETGQESQNAEFLLSNRAALRGGNTPRAILFAARSLLENPSALSAMRQSCRKLAKPSAAHEIVNILQDRLASIYV